MPTIGKSRDLVEGVHSLHLYFNKLWEDKGIIVYDLQVLEKSFEAISLRSGMLSYHMQPILYVQSEEPKIKYPVLYRMKKNELSFIHKIIPTHLHNILIKEAFNAIYSSQEESISSKKMARFIVYHLYYYHFINCDTRDEMETKVLSDIEDIISLLIKKEYTLYKDKPTALLISKLRIQHKSIKAIQLGTAPTNINFRRKKTWS